jgi:hypothetical protein
MTDEARLFVHEEVSVDVDVSSFDDDGIIFEPLL